jgi:hypothetical protein
MLFNSNKKINSEEYEKLFKRITELESKIDIASSNCENLKSTVSSLRGLVNRKIAGEETKEETNDLNNPIILPDHGTPFRNR